MSDSPPLADKPGRREIASDPFNYTLYLTDAGDFELEVLANQSAFYFMVEHRLTPEEVEKYNKRGKDYLDTLGRKVVRDFFRKNRASKTN